MSKRNFTICLWFNDEAKAAAKFYTSIFKDGKIGKVQLYPKVGFEFHQRPEGSVMTVDFIANGQKFIALNGGPLFQFNESISFVVNCKTQKEIDYFWKKLTAQGGREVQCGWLKDKFGISWQIVPAGFQKMMDGKNKEGARRAFSAMFKMKKFEIAKLEKAFRGL